jgi:hypothetical protein
MSNVPSACMYEESSTEPWAIVHAESPGKYRRLSSSVHATLCGSKSNE